ncbi:hypothetical protein GCM10009678_81810 [Actinomadura kijaniata]|uniref:Uncharacterized protein n=1 Tax=Actinomadura namibiensis TaxID=182080 RepID=A0A7W3QQK1_ACTNM|nr:hypothetical protein [Actinomadura namibiensis]MBA8955799.1 hypothetical protein [Actinomadura namibiensis]
MTGPAGQPWGQGGQRPPPVPPQYPPPPPPWQHPPPPQHPPPWQYPPPWQPGPPPPPRPPTRAGRIIRKLNPFLAARAVFRPARSDLIVDPRVRRLQVIRAWAGMVVTLAVALVYQATAPRELASDRFNDAWTNVLILTCALPLVVGAFILACRPPNRGAFARRLRHPLVAVAAMFGSMFCFALAAAPEFGGLREALGPVVLVPAGVALFLWVLPFTVYGIVLSLTHVFRTADIHEVVPPLVSVSASWVIALVNLFTDAYRGVPAALAVALLLGAPLTVSALTCYELRRLRLLHGITLRNTMLR